jgi:hypothetical protein
VYQFSGIYWKSVKQQNLPVTVKYPEMVAKIFPHFDGNEIPDFGKDNLWFLRRIDLSMHCNAKKSGRNLLRIFQQSNFPNSCMVSII